MKTQRKFTVLRGSLDGRGVSRRMDTCTCMAELLCCLPETTTTLLIGYVPSSSAVANSVTPWTVACLLLCPWWFSRQAYWRGWPRPPPGYLPNPGIKPRPPTLQADSLMSEPPGKPRNTGMGCYALFQEIFPTQGLNPQGLPCLPALADGFFTTHTTREAPNQFYSSIK